VLAALFEGQAAYADIARLRAKWETHGRAAAEKRFRDSVEADKQFWATKEEAEAQLRQSQKASAIPLCAEIVPS